MNSVFNKSNAEDKKVKVWVKAHQEDILFGGMEDIVKQLAMKLAQDIYERCYTDIEVEDGVWEVALDVIFPALSDEHRK